jgi:hypothetical protein
LKGSLEQDYNEFRIFWHIFSSEAKLSGGRSGKTGQIHSDDEMTIPFILPPGNESAHFEILDHLFWSILGIDQKFWKDGTSGA